MRLRQPADVNLDAAPKTCAHTWKLRNVSFALPGLYVCDVCDRCGALHIDGPEAITGPASNVADAAATYLESLARPPRPSG